jgi:superfamily I DNA and/or RNA helicase
LQEFFKILEQKSKKNFNSKEICELMEEYALRFGQVIVTTCAESMCTPMKKTKLTFSLVIVDEAGQSTEPTTLMPLYFSKRACLVGDPRQLPPTVINPQSIKAGYGRSLFERGI